MRPENILPYEVSAILHVHTRCSDGSGSPEAVLEAARAAEADVVWVTDHDTVKAADQVSPGWYGRTLWLVGAEVTPPKNHVLAFGVERLPDRGMPLQAIVDAIVQQGGVAVMAHPDDPGNRWFRLPSYRWVDRAVTGPVGVEIWNHLSQWARAVQRPTDLAYALRHPWAACDRPDPRTVAWWDGQGRTTPTLAVGGVDAHAVTIGRRPLAWTVLDYAAVFRTIRTHFLLPTPLSGDPSRDQAALLEAARARRVQVVSLKGGMARGFRLYAEQGDRWWPVGSEPPWHPLLRLTVASPRPARVTLVRDGEPVWVVDLHAKESRVSWRGWAAYVAVPGPNWSAPCGAPGVYRAAADVFLEDGTLVPWVYTNALYVRPASGATDAPDS
jgi:hypothetical protein